MISPLLPVARGPRLVARTPDVAAELSKTAQVHLAGADLGAAGAQVAEWPNRCDDRRYAAVQDAPALRPTVALDGALKAASFGAAQYLTFKEGLGFPEAYTLFVVARHKTASTPGGLVGSGVLAGQSWGCVGVGPADFDPSALTEVVTPTELMTSDDQRFLVEVSYDGARSRMRFNGAAVLDVADVPAPPSTALEFHVGGWPHGTAGTWEGLVYELVVFRRTLSPRERATMTADLIGRYSL